MTRRSCLAGAAALGLSGASATAAVTDFGDVVPGVRTWSESLMLLHFDAQARNGFSVRLSRYPEMNTTWVWCHILFDGRLYAFSERRLPCGADRNLGGAATVSYAAPGAGVAMIRRGPVQALREIDVTVALGAHGEANGADGPGDTAVSLRAVFRPDWLKENAPDGRSEWTGQVTAQIEVAGRTARLAGMAKAHEQTQTDPRFLDPFTYAMLWGTDASLVAVSSPARRYGDWEVERRSAGVGEMLVAPPSRRRRFVIRLTGGGEIEGLAQTVAAYRVPVFDRFWSGNVVRAEVAGHHLVGMVNDWRPEDQTFPLPG